MGILNKLQQARLKIRQSLKKAPGHKPAGPEMEIRQKILDQLESMIKTDYGVKSLPFGKVTVLLQAPTRSIRDAFKIAFLQDGSLKADMLRKLEDAHVRYSKELEISIELDEASGSDKEEYLAQPKFKMNFLKPDPKYQGEIPETNLVIVKGIAEQLSYRMKKERILIGCLSEVHDREGRMVRRNDVVFLDNGDDINSTVSETHARIWFEFKKGEFHIMDEVSRYGTRIVRQGRSIDIPAGSMSGIRLQSGDEIYFGQACLQFEVYSRQ